MPQPIADLDDRISFFAQDSLKFPVYLRWGRGKDSIAELCRKEGINQNLYYRWSKEFLETGKKRLALGLPVRGRESSTMFCVSSFVF